VNRLPLLLKRSPQFSRETFSVGKKNSKGVRKTGKPAEGGGSVGLGFFSGGKGGFLSTLQVAGGHSEVPSCQVEPSNPKETSPRLTPLLGGGYPFFFCPNSNPLREPSSLGFRGGAFPGKKKWPLHSARVVRASASSSPSFCFFPWGL